MVASVEEPGDSPGMREGDIHNDRLETVILPESNIVDLSCQVGFDSADSFLNLII